MRIIQHYRSFDLCSFSCDAKFGRVVREIRPSSEVLSSNAVASAVSLRDDDGNATNEAWRVGGKSRSLMRVYDVYGRLVRGDGAAYAYAADGRLATVATPDATVTYDYATDREDAGYALTLGSGATFTRTVVRDAYRRSLVTAVTNSVNGELVGHLDYAYDALGRPTARNADTFGYDDRGEVTSATIAGVPAAYAYDDIGSLTRYFADSTTSRI